MSIAFTNEAIARSRRNGSIDLLRFIGAVGIIQFHCAAPGGWIGLSALPLFIMLIVFYGADRPISHHANRLLFPWAIWSAIYASLKIAQAIVNGTPIVDEFASWMLLTGTAIHLWFLPFSVLFFVICHPFKEMQISSLRTVVALCSGCAILIMSKVSLPVPLAQWVFVLPAAFTGLLMAREKIPALPPLILAAGCLALILLDSTVNEIQQIIAGLTVALALAFPLHQTKLISRLSAISFGMYLIHPAIFAMVLYVIPRDSLIVFPMTTIGAIIGTYILTKLFPSIV